MTSILVVHSEGEIRDAIQEILRDEGYAVTSAATAEQACCAAHEEPNIIILAQYLIDGRGDELVRRLHQQGLCCHAQILLCCQMALKQWKPNFGDSSFRCLDSPFLIEELLSAVRGLQTNS